MVGHNASQAILHHHITDFALLLISPVHDADASRGISVTAVIRLVREIFLTRFALL
jgi:hypothetical protein